MKKDTEEFIIEQIEILKERVKKPTVYEHIIASILEIYVEDTGYSRAITRMIEEVPALKAPDNKEVFDAVFILSELITSYNKDLRESYVEEIAENVDKWETVITGEIYDFIHNYA